MRNIRLWLSALFAMAALSASPAYSTEMEEEHGHDMLFWAVQVDQLERRWSDGTGRLTWEAEAWYGGDADRLVLKTEGEKPDGEGVEEAELRLLWSRMLNEFWNVQGGVRHDFRPRPQVTNLAVGVEGLAPYFIETEAFLYLSEDADLTAEVKGEFELLLTQRLHLVTEVTLDLSAQSVEEQETGAGLTQVGAGVRLKYEIARKFAPYVGLAWERRLGRTAELVRAEGEEADRLSLVTGLSFWF